jgi:hypothetical protein
MLQTTITPKQWDKAKNNISYFIKKFIVPHYYLGMNRDKFLFYKKLQSVVEEWTENKRVACLVSRQTGMTVASLLYAIHQAIFFENSKIVFIVNKQNSVSWTADILNHILSVIPFTIICNHHKTESLFSFENNSTIRIFSSRNIVNITRGHRLTHILVDNPDWMNNFSDIYTSLIPCLGKDGQLILFGTPSGKNNVLDEFYNKSDFHKQIINYKQVPWQKTKKWLKSLSDSIKNTEILNNEITLESWINK